MSPGAGNRQGKTAGSRQSAVIVGTLTFDNTERYEAHEPARRKYGSILARINGVEIIHYDSHWLSFLRRNQVVHDEICMSLDMPALLVLSPAVQQIRNRIARDSSFDILRFVFCHFRSSGDGTCAPFKLSRLFAIACSSS
jgi:hypothetical protein